MRKLPDDKLKMCVKVLIGKFNFALEKYNQFCKQTKRQISKLSRFRYVRYFNYFFLVPCSDKASDLNFEKKLVATVLQPQKIIVEVKFSESILNHPAYYLEIAKTNAKCVGKNHIEHFALFRSTT